RDGAAGAAVAADAVAVVALLAGIDPAVAARLEATVEAAVALGGVAIVALLAGVDHAVAAVLEPAARGAPGRHRRRIALLVALGARAEQLVHDAVAAARCRAVGVADCGLRRSGRPVVHRGLRCAVAGLAMAAVRVGEAIPAAVDRAVGAAVAVVGVVRYALGGLAVVALLARVDLAVAAVLGRPAVGRAAVAIDVVAIVADLVSRIVEVWVAIRVPERLVGVAVAAALHPLAVRGAAVAAHRVAVVTLLADLHVHDAVA